MLVYFLGCIKSMVSEQRLQGGREEACGGTPMEVLKVHLHLPLQCSRQYISLMKVKVFQLCSTLCDSMDYKVHGILQARILEWVVFPFFRQSSQSRDQTQVSCIAGGFFTNRVICQVLTFKVDKDNQRSELHRDVQPANMKAEIQQQNIWVMII